MGRKEGMEWKEGMEGRHGRKEERNGKKEWEKDKRGRGGGRGRRRKVMKCREEKREERKGATSDGRSGGKKRVDGWMEGKGTKRRRKGKERKEGG
jgi:hypothetical protein